MKKRLLWLYNHSTLIKSEVPIIREMGYEVYIPKIPPFDVSISVDWDSDKFLTVPYEDLDILNHVDFYNFSIPREAMDIMNKYFDYAIFGCFPAPLQSIIMGFKGELIMHPFGLEEDASYTKIIQESIGNWLLLEIEKRAERFWFGQSYENLNEVECELFKRRSVYLPIGMLNTTIEDKWNGKNGKILFVCPRIKINPYYANIYKTFKKNFEGMDYSIGGAQPIMVEDDPTVLGYLNQKEYDELYANHSVMFYHSMEPRHVHYHPFEAIKQGLPLVFMAGGLLDRLGGKELPGRCKTIKEARMKCKRIIEGDKKFAEEIRVSQGVLLESMSYDVCKKVWQENFKIIEKENDKRLQEQAPVKEQAMKIALLIPLPYKGGVLDYTKNLSIALQTGAKRQGIKLNLVIGYPDNNDVDLNREFKNVDVEIRNFKWEKVEEEQFYEIMGIMDIKQKMLRKEYCVANDGIRYFDDCDFLLFMSDRVPEYYFSLRPYGVIVHDYIQRYEPRIMKKYYEGEVMSLVQRAVACFTTSSIVAEDCVQYAGVDKKKIHLLPLFFSDFSCNDYSHKKKDYFCWSTNASFHKNHLTMLEALVNYYEMGGKLDCCLTGVETDLFNPSKIKQKRKGMGKEKYKYIKKISEKISSSDLLKKHVKCLGNLNKVEYYNLLKNAKFLIHPGYADNGNGSAIDATLLGVPVLSSDYPAMRNIENAMNIGISFFDKDNPDEIAALMYDIEKHSEVYTNKLRKVDEIRQFTITNEKLCNEIASIIFQAIFL